MSIRRVASGESIPRAIALSKHLLSQQALHAPSPVPRSLTLVPGVAVSNEALEIKCPDCERLHPALRYSSYSSRGESAELDEPVESRKREAEGEGAKTRAGVRA